MNRIHQPIAHTSPAFSAHARRRLIAGVARLALLGVAGSLASGAAAQSLPSGGNVVAGSADIATSGNAMTINQSSANVAINWQGFGIGQGNQVTFVQPTSQSVALNRVIGSDPSVILGNLSANGKVFLVNPNGVLFGKGAQVNVAGLVASTLDLSDADFMAGRYEFAGASAAAIRNEGNIVADGGYVALLGANVSNQGVIQANMGTVALASGTAVTLDIAGDGLLNVTVGTGAVEALVENGGMIRANGGQVVLTAQAAGQLLKTAVNNSGIIEAQTLQERGGTIKLLGDMHSGTMAIAGTLDASAPNGGDGGFVETSAASVTIADGVRVTTAAASGATGTWLIDPQDFIIAPLGGNISGATLSAQLVTNSVVITTIPASGDPSSVGNGDIIVNDAIAWTASGTPTTLTLNAFRDLNINAAITAVEGNIVACCGRDINVNAPLTTTRGSILLNAGQNVNVRHAITTTDGNIALCAGHDVHIDGAVTLTRGTTIPARSLGLPIGLTLIAGASGTGPGPAGGTIVFAPLAPPVTVTVAPVSIAYNPISYAAPTDFATEFVLTEGAALTQRMLLFPDANRVFDGTTNAVLSGFNTTAASGVPTGVTLVAGPGATASYDSGGVGEDIGITFSGYGLAGPDADRYTLAGSCCTTGFRTTGSIAAASVTPPPTTPPPTPVPTPTPVVPTPTSPTPTSPTPTPGGDNAPPILTPALLALTPILAGAPGGVQLAVLDGGVRLPVIEEEVAPVIVQPVTVTPVVPVPPVPVVPVYPRKQARN